MMSTRDALNRLDAKLAAEAGTVVDEDACAIIRLMAEALEHEQYAFIQTLARLAKALRG